MHVPFRDKASHLFSFFSATLSPHVVFVQRRRIFVAAAFHQASQCWAKPVARHGRPKTQKTTTSDEPNEPEPEAQTGEDFWENAPMEEDHITDEDVAEWVPEPPGLPVKRPTLQQYQEKWDASLTRHSRAIPGDFSRDNLVPQPIPQLWQDCPYVSFKELKSEDAQARLSVCRPHSSLEPASCLDGVPRYAHNTGDVNFRRRAPLQVSSTMGFVLNQLPSAVVFFSKSHRST